MQCHYFIAFLLLVTVASAQKPDGPVDPDFEVAILEESDSENASPSAVSCQPAETDVEFLTLTEASSSLVAPEDISTVGETLEGIEVGQHLDDEALGSDIAEDELEGVDLEDNSAGDVSFHMVATLVASFTTGLAILVVL